MMFQKNEIRQGLYYFTLGWQLIRQKGLRRFVVLPVLINILLLSGLLWLFVDQMHDVVDTLIGFMPQWLDWLGGVVFILSVFMMLVLFYFTFTALSGFIAAPFNGLLAEKVESMLTEQNADNLPFSAFLKDIPRVFRREWQKLCYSLPRLACLFILGCIPLIGQTFIPILAFLFSAWMMAIQYCDYPFDNHKVPFFMMKEQLSQHKTMNLTFGALVSVCTFIPLVNLVIIPVAVCAATAMWVGEYRQPSKANLSTKAKYPLL